VSEPIKNANSRPQGKRRITHCKCEAALDEIGRKLKRRIGRVMAEKGVK
jgi:hypothetical protein